MPGQSRVHEAGVQLPCDPAVVICVQVHAVPASGSNPGIPPSSLMSLLHAKPAIAGTVLADFDSAFTNRLVNLHSNTFSGKLLCKYSRVFSIKFFLHKLSTSLVTLLSHYSANRYLPAWECHVVH